MDVRQSKRLDFLERCSVNNHSNHCEAKGPIVKEGFVAARIRAIQGAYNPTSLSSWSHSPMVPCQLYQRLEKHESDPKMQAPVGGLQRPPIGLTGSSAAGFNKPFSEDCSKHGSLNDHNHFLSGGGIGVEYLKSESKRVARTPLFQHSNSPQSDQQIHQTSPQGSSNDTKTYAQEGIFNSVLLPQTEHGQTSENSNRIRLEDTAVDLGRDSTLGREGDEEYQPVQSLGVSFAEELDNLLDHASQRPNSANEGYITAHKSSPNSTNVDRERMTLEGQDLYLKSSPASNQSLRLLSRRSRASLLPTTDEGLTSLEKPRIKKQPVRHKSKEQETHGDRVDDSLTIEPRDNGQVFLRSPASPKNTQQVFSQQPSARASKDTFEPVDLGSLTTEPQTSRSLHQDKSVFPIGNFANQSSDQAKPQHSITPTKSPRSSTSHSSSLFHRFFSGAPEKPPQTVSDSQSPQAQRTWSCWKTLPADTQSDATDVLEKGLDSVVRGREEPDNTLSLPKVSDQTGATLDAEVRPAALEIKHHGKSKTNSTTAGDTLPKVNESRTPYRAQSPPEPRTFLSSASPYPDTAPQRNPRPQRSQHHLSEWVVSLPLEALSKNSSGSASPVRREAASSPNGSLKAGNNGQKIKRVQIIISLDGSSDVMIEASMKKKKDVVRAKRG